MKSSNEEVSGEFHERAEQRDFEGPRFRPDAAVAYAVRKRHEQDRVHHRAVVVDDDAGAEVYEIEADGVDDERAAMEPAEEADEIGEDRAYEKPRVRALPVEGVPATSR